MQFIEIRRKLLEHANRQPNKTALVFPDDDRSVNYAQFADDVAAVAATLSSKGVGRQTRVAILLPNSYQTVLAWFATNILGGIECPLGYFLEAESVAKQLELIDPDIVIAERSKWSADFSDPDILTLLIDDVAGDDLAEFVGTDRIDLDSVDDAWQRADDTVAIFATSGTTGIPKGVTIPRRYASETSWTWIRLAAAVPDDVMYNPLSLWHGNTQFMTVLAALDLGATAVVPRKFSASRFWEHVRTYGVTTVNYHASMLGILLKRGIDPTQMGRSMRLMVGGGCPATTLEEFERETGVRILELYGLTEFMLTLSNAIDTRRVGSCGRVTDNFEVQVVDENDEPVPVGTAGQLVIRPRVPSASFGGYWRNEHATVSATRNLWFHTGDIVQMDNDGYVFFIDRAGNYIRKSGENIPASSIEETAKRCAWVEEAAAVGVPGEFGDEDIKLVVVPGAAQGSVEALLDVLSRELPPYAVPRYIEIRDRLPMNSSLRVVKGELRSIDAAEVIDTRSIRETKV